MQPSYAAPSASEDAAKAAWLAKQQPPSWGKRVTALAPAQSDTLASSEAAPEPPVPTSEAVPEPPVPTSGPEVAPDPRYTPLSAAPQPWEGAAKATWLAKQETQSWGKQVGASRPTPEISPEPPLPTPEPVPELSSVASDPSAPPIRDVAMRARAIFGELTSSGTPPEEALQQALKQAKREHVN